MEMKLFVSTWETVTDKVNKDGLAAQIPFADHMCNVLSWWRELINEPNQVPQNIF